jgi:hypothetical protein
MAAPWGRECSRNRGISPIIVKTGVIRLAGWLGLDGKRMDVGAQQIFDRGIDQPVPRYGRDPPKGLRDDADPKVAPPIGSACMARMAMTFILNM